MFGDSYTSPNYCVNSQDSFWGLTASALDVKEIVNCSWLGNGFESIKHMCVGMQLQFDFANDFLIIGIPPLERLTVFDNYKNTRYNSICIDPNTWKEHKQEITCHTGLQVLRGHESQQMVIYEDRAWTETQVLTSLFLLTQWLEFKRANYLVVNLSKPLDENNVWGPSSFVLPWALNHDRMILFKDTYYSVNENIHKPTDFDRHGWMGHHGAAGNRHFFETSVRQKLC